MKKPEQWFWRNRLRPVLASIPGLHYERVESRTCVGIPDLHITTAAGHGWIEMKVGELKDGFVYVPTLTPVQAGWIYSRGRMCGRVWVVVWDPKASESYLFDHSIGGSMGKSCCVPIDESIGINMSKGDWEDLLL